MSAAPRSPCTTAAAGSPSGSPRRQALLASLGLRFAVDTASPTGTALGILFLLAAIVFQKYVLLALRMDYLGLSAKDWAFQGFMTFCLWFR